MTSIDKLILGLAVVAAIAFAPGCGRIKTQDQVVRLTDYTNAYSKSIRWSEFETAKQYLRSRDGDLPALDEDLLKGIRVTAMDILTRKVINEAAEAVVTSRVTFFHTDVGSVRSFTDTQIWWFDETTRKWYLDGSLPDFAGSLSGE